MTRMTGDAAAMRPNAASACSDQSAFPQADRLVARRRWPGPPYRTPIFPRYFRSMSELRRPHPAFGGAAGHETAVADLHRMRRSAMEPGLRFRIKDSDEWNFGRSQPCRPGQQRTSRTTLGTV